MKRKFGNSKFYVAALVCMHIFLNGSAVESDEKLATIKEVVSAEISKKIPIFADNSSFAEVMRDFGTTGIWSVVFYFSTVYSGLGWGDNLNEAYSMWKNNQSDRITWSFIGLSLPCSFVSSVMVYVYGRAFCQKLAALCRKVKTQHVSIANFERNLQEQARTVNCYEMIIFDLWYRTFEQALMNHGFIQLKDGCFDENESHEFVAFAGESCRDKMKTIGLYRVEYEKNHDLKAYTKMVEVIRSLVAQLWIEISVVQ